MAGPVSESPLEVNELTAHKHCRSLQESTFILLFLDSNMKAAGKRPY